MGGNKDPNRNRQQTHSNLMRDGNPFCNLWGIATPANLDPNVGLFLPDTSIVLPECFCVTQVVISSNFDFYWELISNYEPVSGNFGDDSRRVFGTAMEGILVSLPLTQRLRSEKDTQFIVRTDTVVGGGPIPPGNARFQLIGYFEDVS